MTNPTTAAVQHYIRKGGNAANGARLLAELVRTVSPSNLPHALHYNGFVSLRGADALAARLGA